MVNERLIKERIKLNKDSLLEIGCGKALMLVELAKRNPSIHHVGVEKEGIITLKAARYATRNDVDNVSFIRGDITSLGNRLRGRCPLI